MSVFKYVRDADGIVTVTMDMTGPVNSMSDEFLPALQQTVADLQAEEQLTGVVLASAKKTFFAGGNLNDLVAVTEENAEAFFQQVEAIKVGLRGLETLPVPVVAAINGAALGGGYEICLACNHRVAYNHKSVLLGLPEATLGLLPGGGGVVRLVNLLGLEKALPYLLEGKRVTPEKALDAGMIHEIVDSVDELIPRAKAFILENRDKPEAAQNPWDIKGFKIPGGSPSSPRNAHLGLMAPTMLRNKTQGLLPAPEVIMDTAFQAASVDFDTAMRIESRGLVQLALTPQAKNMITTFFFQMNKVNGGASRPANVAPTRAKKVGILGAGMMGQGIAYATAMAGIDVVLKDITQEAAAKGKAYTEKLLAKRVAKGRMDETRKDEVLALIKPTADDTDLLGCDLIIEAVFENIQLKHQITQATEKYLADNGVWGSNTSSLPITQLAEASARPENFIGIHFFSPVDKMPLIEIICGEKTSDETLAKAFDYALQIKKTPIVVNDSLGFYTSRTFSTYYDEGVRMVNEGVHPIIVDNLGKAIGMPVGPLTVHDEVSQELSYKGIKTWTEMGVNGKFGEMDQLEATIKWMVEDYGRGGRHHGGGYYDYVDGKRAGIWQGLLDKYYDPDVQLSHDDIKDRMLFRQVIETLKCLQTNVLRGVADGNVGSILGIGAPAWTGGFIQFVNTYGLQKFQARCQQLQAQYGERFACPQIVADKIAAGEIFE